MISIILFYFKFNDIITSRIRVRYILLVRRWWRKNEHEAHFVRKMVKIHLWLDTGWKSAGWKSVHWRMVLLLSQHGPTLSQNNEVAPPAVHPTHILICMGRHQLVMWGLYGPASARTRVSKWDRGIQNSILDLLSPMTHCMYKFPGGSMYLDRFV